MNPEKFKLASCDVGKVLAQLSELGLQLGDALGEGEPEITDEIVAFNGSAACGHPQNLDVVIPWPAPGAGGVATTYDDQAGGAIAGSWFAGASLSTRVCNGDCSYEGFVVERDLEPDEWQTGDEKGRYFNFCKTAFRPYDLAVTAALIVFKHYFGDDFQVSSDGEDEFWFDGRMACYTVLGYGMKYHLAEGEHGGELKEVDHYVQQ